MDVPFRVLVSDAYSEVIKVAHYTLLSRLQLLRTFYAEGLVDRKTFVIWLLQQMVTCNLAQAGFIACLAEEYLDGMTNSRALTAPFIEACLAKLSEVKVLLPGIFRHELTRLRYVLVLHKNTSWQRITYCHPYYRYMFDICDVQEDLLILYIAPMPCGPGRVCQPSYLDDACQSPGEGVVRRRQGESSTFLDRQ